MRFLLAFPFLLALLTACTNDPAANDTKGAGDTQVAQSLDEEPGDEKPAEVPKTDQSDSNDLGSLELSERARRKMTQRLYADALFYSPLDTTVDYTVLDTTDYGSSIDFHFEVTFQNEQLIAVKTTQQWCAAYCDGAIFGTVFNRSNGAVISNEALFDAPQSLARFQERVVSDFKDSLAKRMEQITDGPDTEETAMEHSALAEYCQHWQADQFLLTQSGLLFNQDCGMPHVIQAFDFSPDLLYPYSRIEGLSNRYFREGR